MREKDRKLYYRRMKAEMALRGITWAQIARSVGMSAPHVLLSIQGRRYCKKVNDALMEHGIPSELLIDKELECNGFFMFDPGTTSQHGVFKTNTIEKAEGF